MANSGCDRSCCSDWIRLSLTLVFVPSGHCWYDKSKIKPCPTHKPINHFNHRKANVKKREKKKKDLLVLPLPLICSCVSGRKDYPLPTGLYHHLPLHPLSPTHSMIVTFTLIFPLSSSDTTGVIVICQMEGIGLFTL